MTDSVHPASILPARAVTVIPALAGRVIPAQADRIIPAQAGIQGFRETLDASPRGENVVRQGGERIPGGDDRVTRSRSGLIPPATGLY